MKWRKALGFQIILDILIALWWDYVHCLKSFVIELHGFKQLHLYWILFTTMLNFSTYCGYFNCQHKILAVLNWFNEILIKFKDLWHYPRDCINNAAFFLNCLFSILNLEWDVAFDLKIFWKRDCQTFNRHHTM